MSLVKSFRLLGTHSPDGTDYFDGADMVLDTDDGPRVLGFRTAGYVDRHDPFDADDAGPVTWGDGYEPLAITLDRSTVKFWDFGDVMWIGPDPDPCLFWSNADGISVDGLRRMLAPIGSGKILLGPTGLGLPSPDALGLVVRDGLTPIEPTPLRS